MNKENNKKILFTNENGILHINLNHEEKSNALDQNSFIDLSSIIKEELKSNTEILILTAEGKNFCSGFDLTSVSLDVTILEQYVKSLCDIIQAIRKIKIPVIAAVQGAVLAGGCALALSADHIIACANTVMGYPVHRIGLSPLVSLGILEAHVSSGAARSLLLSGQLINSEQCLRLGMINELCETYEETKIRAFKLANKIQSNSHFATVTTREWLNYLDKTDTVAVRKGEQGSLESCEGPFISERLKKFFKKN